MLQKMKKEKFNENFQILEKDAITFLRLWSFVVKPI